MGLQTKEMVKAKLVAAEKRKTLPPVYMVGDEAAKE